MNTSGHEVCRLCGGDADERFRLSVLRKYPTRYFCCARCGSLQTENPTWLAEAYANSNLASIDTGALQRNLNNMAATFAVAKLLKIRNVIDVGGGDGLLCRLLRDHDLNCYVEDRHATPTYAQAFSVPDFAAPDLLLSFEVMEHLANPSVDLGTIFDRGAGAVLASTELFKGQGMTWWYLAPEAGQHVFFYSPRGLLLIAERYGYQYAQFGSYHLFTREPLAGFKQAILKRSLVGRGLRLLRGIAVMARAEGCQRDFETITRAGRG